MLQGAIKRELSGDSCTFAALAGALAVAFGAALWLYLAERDAHRRFLRELAKRQNDPRPEAGAHWARKAWARHGA